MYAGFFLHRGAGHVCGSFCVALTKNELGRKFLEDSRCVCVCGCVYVRERGSEIERERVRKRETERERDIYRERER